MNVEKPDDGDNNKTSSLIMVEKLRRDKNHYSGDQRQKRCQLNQCSDGLDNDSDGFFDLDDFNCFNSEDDSEYDPFIFIFRDRFEN